MIITAAALCTALIIFFFVIIMEYARRGKGSAMRRVQRYTGAPRAAEAAESQALGRIIAAVREWARKMNRFDALDLKMRQAGLPLLGVEFLLLALLGAGIAWGIMAVLGGDMFLASLVAAAVLVAEWGYIAFRIHQRRQNFTAQLGDCLATVADAMRAGFSFVQAMELISREMEPPISEEFGRTTQDMGLGVPMEQALVDMAARVGSTDFDLVVTAVLIQRQTGGNLAKILDIISNTINDRIRMRREAKALTTQGRMSGYVMACLPIIFVAGMSILSPGYIEPLMESDTGRIAMVGAIVMECIGLLVINRIVNIDV